MRYLAIGDIHGCSTALIRLSEFAAFTADDVVITLGDYVNRGPDARGVLAWLLRYRQRGKLIALRGNHDIVMLHAREHAKGLRAFLQIGGDKTLASYAKDGRKAQLDDVPSQHWEFLEETVPYYEIDTHFFVHANAYPGVPLDQQPDFMLFWEKFHQPPPHQSGKTMVCGHTSQKSFEPINIGHAICLDTRCFGGGWLTCMDAKSGRLWQANQQGKTQGGWIDDYRASAT